MIISLSGMPGSGKSTVAKLLAEKLGYKRHYMGGLRRDLAKEKGITLDELNKLGETDPATDKEVDEHQKTLGETEDNFIIEGRTSYFFIPHSKKVFVDVDFNEGAKRIFKDLQHEEKRKARNETKNEPQSLDEMKEFLKQRLESDKKRYQKWYNTDYLDRNNFDIIVDSTKLSPEEVVEKILSEIKEQSS